MPDIATPSAGLPRRILIVGLNYWPEETGNAPYTTALAEHLAAHGSRVTVIAGMPYYPQWHVSAPYRRRMLMRETVRGVRIHRYRQYVPRSQSALRRACFEATFLVNALPMWRVPQPDIVLGIVPSLGDGVLARAAARRFGVPYGLLFQDLVGRAAEQSGIAGGGRVARAAGAIESWLARGAAGVGVVSEGFRDTLLASGVAPERLTYLPNWSHIPPPRGSRESTRAGLGWNAETQVVLHAGNMGLKQALEHVVAAARLAAWSRPRLHFVLMGNGNQRPALEALTAGLPNITFLDPQPADRFPDVLHAADVLLVNERPTVTDMSLPSKLTSYFVAGRPVVAAVTAGGATERAVAASGAGLVVAPGDAAALLAAFDRLAEDPPLRERLSAAGPIFAHHHLNAREALSRQERFVSSLLPAPLPRATVALSQGAA